MNFTAIITCCASCGKASSNHCSRCNKTQYCSRECQLSHWVMHRKICRPHGGETSDFEQLFMGVIGGNIYAAAASVYMGGQFGVVSVAITESYGEFTKGDGSLHFAHIQCVDHGEYVAHAKKNYSLDLECMDISALNRECDIPLVILFSDKIVYLIHSMCKGLTLDKIPQKVASGDQIIHFNY